MVDGDDGWLPRVRKKQGPVFFLEREQSRAKRNRGRAKESRCGGQIFENFHVKFLVSSVLLFFFPLYFPRKTLFSLFFFFSPLFSSPSVSCFSSPSIFFLLCELLFIADRARTVKANKTRESRRNEDDTDGDELGRRSRLIREK